MPNLFQKAIMKQNTDRPPIWLMRQAGRYHSHYQDLKKKHTFMELCKIPEVACETTLGPIRDFDFDAAILFSDLLFPLEVMGMGLDYVPGPKLGWHLKSKQDVTRLRGGASLGSQLDYQAQAMKLIRAELSPTKGLIGFVGGPLTLFFYAVQGSHQGELDDARKGMKDGRFEGFFEKLVDLLAHNMALQARAGADTIAMLDTCAGEVDLDIYSEVVKPSLAAVMERFQRLCPETPITYYSKGTSPEYWSALNDLPISCLGVDWSYNLAQVLDRFSERFAIQGNVDPSWLLELGSEELERRLRQIWGEVKSLPQEKRRGWICGLGHGVLQHTPEENVRSFVRLSREIFSL